MADQRIEPILAESVTTRAPVITASVPVVVPKSRRPRRLGELLEQEHILAGALLAPTLVILTLFIAYTFVYTFIATALKLALGMAAALLLNQHFRFKRIVRAGMLLPWIVPTVLSTLAWQWMFDATFSVFNWMLMNVGLISQRILWLGDGTMAMGCLILVNVWRGMPFFAITLLAGLQT